MFKNLKFMGVLLISVLLLTNCNKDANQDKLQEGELTFATIDIDPDKAIICQEDMAPTHAVVKIKDDQGVETTYYPLTFYIDGELFTQSIKLPAGDYTLEEFVIVYHPENLDADDHSGDVPLKATPMAGSPYADFLEYGGLARDISIAPFQKYQMWIEVLCYIPAEWDNFGFQWFHVHEIVIREQCFFGDFCIKHAADYEGSLYDEGGVQMDEIAIFMIDVYRKGDNENVWTQMPGGDNETTYNNGSPLCIQYADRVGVVDHFKFVLSIYVKVGAGYDYVEFYTWYFDDAGVIDHGGDGVVDFVLGNCNYTDPDLLLPPYMNLPCDFEYTVIQFPYDPSYFQVNFDGIDDGYDIADGNYDAWCADKYHTIGVGPTYDMCAYSSLYPWLLPNSCNGPIDWSTKGSELNRANWLFNNLDYVESQVGAWTSVQFQDALWNIFDNLGAGGVAGDISDMTVGHEDFSPLPAGWAAVLMFPADLDCANIQITFRVVDP